mgnify:CR=1 FL=1
MRSFKKPLKAEEERYYLKMYRDGDEKAKEKLIEHNLRLVAHIVKKYNSPDRDLDDLISIGTIGLIKAVNTFDLNKGGRLVTYAARCIENELLMMIRQEKKILREVSLYEPIGTDQEGNHISLHHFNRRSRTHRTISSQILSKPFRTGSVPSYR